MAKDPSPADMKVAFIKIAVEAMLKDATAKVRFEIAELLRKLADQISTDTKGASA